MSMMNVYVEHAAAHVIVDTHSSIDGRPGDRFDVSKFELYPVARSLVAYVGRGDLASHLGYALRLGMPQDVEALQAALPKALEFLLERLAPDETPGGTSLASTFVLVGYSQRAERMKCTAFECKPDEAGVFRVTTTRAPEGCITPTVPGRPFKFAGRDSMIDHARLQVAHAQTAYPEQACGGRLLAITVDESSFQIQDCGPAC